MASGAPRDLEGIGWSPSVTLLVRWPHPSPKGVITEGGSVPEPTLLVPSRRAAATAGARRRSNMQNRDTLYKVDQYRLPEYKSFFFLSL